MSSRNILALLEGGDRRSIGRSDKVAAIVGGNPSLFPKLVAGLWSPNPLVRMRAADAVEKLTRTKPTLLSEHKKELLGLMQETGQQELRWHLAAMTPRFSLTRNERQRVAAILHTYLEDRSSIVKTFALQALADLARQQRSMRAEVVERLRESARSGTAAMRARSRKLLAQFEDD